MSERAGGQREERRNGIRSNSVLLNLIMHRCESRSLMHDKRGFLSRSLVQAVESQQYNAERCSDLGPTHQSENRPNHDNMKPIASKIHESSMYVFMFTHTIHLIQPPPYTDRHPSSRVRNRSIHPSKDHRHREKKTG